MYEDQLTVEGETSKERPMDDEAFGRPEKPISITVAVRPSGNLVSFLGGLP